MMMMILVLNGDDGCGAGNDDCNCDDCDDERARVLANPRGTWRIAFFTFVAQEIF